MEMSEEEAEYLMEKRSCGFGAFVVDTRTALQRHEESLRQHGCEIKEVCPINHIRSGTQHLHRTVQIPVYFGWSETVAESACAEGERASSDFHEMIGGDHRHA